jgi:hypothetical protein
VSLPALQHLLERARTGKTNGPLDDPDAALAALAPVMAAELVEVEFVLRFISGQTGDSSNVWRNHYLGYGGGYEGLQACAEVALARLAAVDRQASE